MCFRGHVGWRTGLFSAALWPFSGLGVTAGAHRLWTHQSYKATLPMEALLLIMYSTADQGPIGAWALADELHHRASDTKQDPHNRRRGFWHAHIGWMFSPQASRIIPRGHDRIGLGPLVRWHDKVWMVWDPLCSLVVPAVVASLWGEAQAGFFVAGALRWCFVQHATFLVNSLAHDERDVDDKYAFDAGSKGGIGPRASLLVTIVALGEGWHDYHHTFPWDYAAAELGALEQWNPTKAFIDTCALLGLVKDRKRCSPEMQRARRNRSSGRSLNQEYEVKGQLCFRYLQPVLFGGSLDFDAQGGPCPCCTPLL